MTSGKPPRRTKASSVPVTIDLDADRAREKPQPDEGLTAEQVIAEDSAMAASEGSPKSELDEIDNANRDLGDTGPFPATSSETLTDKESDPNRSDTLSADELTEPPPRPSVSETPRAYGFGEAALDADLLRLGAFAAVDGEISVAHRGHEGCMALEYAEFTLRAGDDDHIDLFRVDEAFRGDEFEMEGH